VDQYPLYSRADEALWMLGDSDSRMGNRFRKESAEAYTRIVRDYPLSSYADEAKKKLQELEAPIPQADPAAYARMKYDLDHRTKLGMRARAWDMVRRGPDVHNAAKAGPPAMTTLRPTVPVSVPAVEDQQAPGFRGDVSATRISSGESSDLDKKPDARMSPPQAANGQPQTPADANLTPSERLAKLPSNHTLSEKERRRLEKKYKEQQKKNAKKQPPAGNPANPPAAPASNTAAPAAAATTPPSSSSNQ
jgi:outer membrane protein assembly factor BamD